VTTAPLCLLSGGLDSSHRRGPGDRSRRSGDRSVRSTYGQRIARNWCRQNSLAQTLGLQEHLTVAVKSGGLGRLRPHRSAHRFQRAAWWKARFHPPTCRCRRQRVSFALGLSLAEARGCPAAGARVNAIDYSRLPPTAGPDYPGRLSASGPICGPAKSGREGQGTQAPWAPLVGCGTRQTDRSRGAPAAVPDLRPPELLRAGGAEPCGAVTVAASRDTAPQRGAAALIWPALAAGQGCSS